MLHRAQKMDAALREALTARVQDRARNASTSKEKQKYHALRERSASPAMAHGGAFVNPAI